MPFCCQSRSLLDFSAWFCSHLECVNLCKVIVLCLWILCSNLSVHPGTSRGLLASSKYLPLFVLLIFSTSLVGKLWVCNCLGAIPLFGFFRINVFLPLVIHLGTCAVCRHLFISSACLS